MESLFPLELSSGVLCAQSCGCAVDGVAGPIHHVSFQGWLGPAACTAVGKAVQMECQICLFVEEKLAVFRESRCHWSFRLRRISEMLSLIIE